MSQPWTTEEAGRDEPRIPATTWLTEIPGLLAEIEELGSPDLASWPDPSAAAGTGALQPEG